MAGYYRLSDLGFRLAAGAHVIKRAELSAVDEATRLLGEAERRAAEIVADAQKAYEDEKLRGYQDGLANAKIEAVQRLLDESAVLDQSLVAIERDLSRITAASVRKLIDEFDDKARAEAVIRVALKQMRREKRAELRVSSRLYEHFRGRIGEIMKDFPEVDLVDVVGDPALDPSQIILETSIGRVDGDLGARIEDLESVIRSAFSRASADTLDVVSQQVVGQQVVGQQVLGQQAAGETP